MTRVTMQGERVPLLAREGTPARLVRVRDESVAKTTRWSRLAMMATGAVALVGVVGHATGGLRSARSENHLGLGPSTVPYNDQYKGPLFIHIPKNGGTAIELLAAYNGVRYVSGGHKEGLFQESEVFFLPNVVLDEPTPTPTAPPVRQNAPPRIIHTRSHPKVAHSIKHACDGPHGASVPDRRPGHEPPRPRGSDLFFNPQSLPPKIQPYLTTNPQQTRHVRRHQPRELRVRFRVFHGPWVEL